MKLYEVYSVDSGKSHRYTQREAERLFGKIEFKEIVSGYLPNLVAVEVQPLARVDEEYCEDCRCYHAPPTWPEPHHSDVR